MAGLQNGAKFLHLPPPWDPIWRPEVGSTFGILLLIVITRVWSGLSANSNGYTHVFEVAQIKYVIVDIEGC